MRERKNGVVTIEQTVIRISSVTSRCENRKIENFKNGRQTKWRSVHNNNTTHSNQNAFGKRVTVNVRTVLLLVKIAKNMKPLL